jgi:predicted  nucleic acid-binding Zn-ribbon protein
MKADPTHQRLLLDLQEIDNHVAVNLRAQKSIPQVEIRSRVSAELSALAPSFIAANGALEDLKSEIARIEDDVRMVNERLAQDISRRDTSASSKDIAGFEHEITTLNARKVALEESELVVMQRLEDAEAELESIAVAREALNTELSRLDDVIDSESARLASEAQSLSSERSSLAAKIDSDLVALYNKQRERYGIGAALLTRGVSGGSGVALTASDLDRVRHAESDDVVMCPDSNCILIRTEESGL